MTNSNTLLWTTDLRQVHDHLAELDELGASQRLRHVVCDHIVGWTIFDGNLLVLDQASDVKVLDVEMASALARASLAILFELHCALVVAVNDIFLDLKALSFEKKFRPQNF